MIITPPFIIQITLACLRHVVPAKPVLISSKSFMILISSSSFFVLSAYASYRVLSIWVANSPKSTSPLLSRSISSYTRCASSSSVNMPSFFRSLVTSDWLRSPLPSISTLSYSLWRETIASFGRISNPVAGSGRPEPPRGETIPEALCFKS